MSEEGVEGECVPSAQPPTSEDYQYENSYYGYDDETNTSSYYYYDEDYSVNPEEDYWGSGRSSLVIDDLPIEDNSNQTNETEETQEGTNRRQRIVEEILQTEQAYVHNLYLTIKNFLLPVKQVVGTPDQLLKEDQISTIFSNLEEIYQMNNEFLTDLETRLQEGQWNSETDTIADLFLVRIPDFASTYPPYVASHHKSLVLLSQLEKKQSWVNFLQKVKEKGETGKLDITGFLIMPVQRIPRYELLLKDLVKCSEESHPDYSDLNQAIKELTEIASSVNKSMRKQDNYKKLCKIEKNLSGFPQFQLAIEDRMLVKEGSLMKICRKIPKKRYFFLLSDILIYTAMPTQLGVYKFNRMFKLEDSLTKIKDVKDTDDVKNAFQIIGSEKSFTVFAETPEEKQSWMRGFHSVLNMRVHSGSGLENQFSIESDEAPIWVPDNKTKFCMLCGAYFTVVRRRHHCRNCGKVICGSCSGFKSRLSHTDKEVRVCRICFNYIKIKDGTYEEEEKPKTRSRSSTTSSVERMSFKGDSDTPPVKQRTGTFRRAGSLFGTKEKPPKEEKRPQSAITPVQEDPEISKQFRIPEKDLKESLSKIWGSKAGSQLIDKQDNYESAGSDSPRTKKRVQLTLSVEKASKEELPSAESAPQPTKKPIGGQLLLPIPQRKFTESAPDLIEKSKVSTQRERSNTDVTLSEKLGMHVPTKPTIPPPQLRGSPTLKKTATISTLRESIPQRPNRPSLPPDDLTGDHSSRDSITSSDVESKPPNKPPPPRPSRVSIVDQSV